MAIDTYAFRRFAKKANELLDKIGTYEFIKLIFHGSCSENFTKKWPVPARKTVKLHSLAPSALPLLPWLHSHSARLTFWKGLSYTERWSVYVVTLSTCCLIYVTDSQQTRATFYGMEHKVLHMIDDDTTDKSKNCDFATSKVEKNCNLTIDLLSHICPGTPKFAGSSNLKLVLV